MTAKLKPEAREALAKQIPLASLGQPEDVANAVLFLASPAARYITGQVLAGGRRHGDVTFFDSGLDGFRIVA